MVKSAVPQISVESLAARLKSPEPFVLLDVREDWELNRAAIRDSRLQVKPLSRLSREGTAGLPADAQAHDAEVYVLCHLGPRSDQVTAWLVSQGWTRTFSVTGGIDAYARKIDRSVGSY
ncbi:MAG: rhodanese-like domain-containing protein [Anaerolineales bacterium]|jgi:rhodanese-related sulfurtransferase